ncbi:MAG: hypothetical protein NTV98_00980 [Candidatus Roizmanbacteria bacterium]|nr:hypothetical protein [Candidatus Roizmanbacteria bacterium]
MQKNIRKIAIGFILVIVVAGVAYWVQQYLRGTKASSVPVAQFALPDGATISPGNPFELILQINPNLKTFYSFDLSFVYDQTKVSPTDAANAANMIIPVTDDIKILTNNTHVDPVTHTVQVMGIRQTTNNTPFMGNAPISLVKVLFNMNPDSKLPVSFAWNDTSRTSLPDTIEKKNLDYTGVQPIVGATGTSTNPVLVATTTPVPGVTTRPTPTRGPSPTPVIGGAGAEAETTAILERTDTLYINSLVLYQAPFRYEQSVKLERGDYVLTLDAIAHVKRGPGLVLALLCNEAVCGTYKKNDIIFKTPTFPLKSSFSEYQGKISIVDGPADKELLLRIFCEDGSECEIDRISIEDAWGSERLKNSQFADFKQISEPRIQPNTWEIDSTANMYGSIDKTMGVFGSLLINNSAE